MRFPFAVMALLMSAPALGGTCSAVSADTTVALVELYTSEGCDSCPPADRWLSSLGGRGLVPGRVVPLSLHVDYWDYIGWKDPFAKPEYAGRQRKLTQLQRLAFVYTPQVMLQGQDFRAWRNQATFDTALARINAQPARARIALTLASASAAGLTVDARAELLDRAHLKDAALYLAAYENRLASPVTAGENRGRTLEHDYVVLEWLGPTDFPPAGALTARRALPLLPKAVAENSVVVAFVQNRRSLEVIQALRLPACPAARPAAAG